MEDETPYRDGRALSITSSKASGERSVSDDRQIASLIGRLLVHYWTENMPASMREAQAQDWLEDLREFGPGVVSAACTEWRQKPGGKRPTPGDIRVLCIERQRFAKAFPALPARDTTEEDARRLADKWAQGHGYSDIEAYQAVTFQGNGLWVGNRWYFEGWRKFECAG